jgi:Leucine-rich repeat (LRR) protein
MELRCSNHELEQLSKLPDNLCKLFCSDNKLTSLPELSDKLTVLDCSNNQLTHILNKRIPNLRELICHGNPLIQSLDEIRTSVPESCHIKY